MKKEKADNQDFAPHENQNSPDQVLEKELFIGSLRKHEDKLKGKNYSEGLSEAFRGNILQSLQGFLL